MLGLRVGLLAALCLHLFAPLGAAGRPAPAKVPVLLDTDIGGEIDDALALALALASPEVDLRGVTTVHGDAHTRALIVCRWLHAAGRSEIAVAAGAAAERVPTWDGQLQYGLRPAFRKRPEKELASLFLYSHKIYPTGIVGLTYAVHPS